MNNHLHISIDNVEQELIHKSFAFGQKNPRASSVSVEIVETTNVGPCWYLTAKFRTHFQVKKELAAAIALSQELEAELQNL